MPLGADIIGNTKIGRQVAEANRQALTGDDRFYKKFLYFFELRVPRKIFAFGGGDGRIFFPLVLNPQVYSIGDPFTLTVTPTLGGGVFVEQNGVLARPIRIAGTTGFEPRRQKTPGMAATNHLIQSKLDYLPRGHVPIMDIPLSGQARFINLQDRIFRLYSALLQNPDTSEEVELYWHNPKDQEHWRVVPVSFNEQRARRGSLYYYDIQLLAIAPGDVPHTDLELSEDRDLFDDIKDVRRSIRDGVDTVNGVLTNLENLEREISNEISSWVNTVGDIVNITGSAAAFVQGTTDAILQPFRAVTDLIDTLAAATESLEAAVIAGQTIPDALMHEFDRMQAGVESLALFGDRYQTNLSSRYKALEGLGEVTAAEVSGATAATSYSALRYSGTNPGPGDALTNQRRRTTPARQVRGASRYEVLDGDTIEEIAARKLGDANRWMEIVELNNLRAPFISAAGIPGTKRPGDALLIPANASDPATRPLPVILGVPPDAEQDDRLYGVDWRTEPVFSASGRFPRGYDWIVDHNGTDFRPAKGVANLIQGVRARVETEQGSDPQYRHVGVPVTIGTSLGAGLDEETLKIQYAGAVRADPRIAIVQSTRVDNTTQADQVAVTISAVPYGSTERTTIQASPPRSTPGT